MQRSEFRSKIRKRTDREDLDFDGNGSEDDEDDGDNDDEDEEGSDGGDRKNDRGVHRLSRPKFGIGRIEKTTISVQNYDVDDDENGDDDGQFYAR